MQFVYFASLLQYQFQEMAGYLGFLSQYTQQLQLAKLFLLAFHCESADTVLMQFLNKKVIDHLDIHSKTMEIQMDQSILKTKSTTFLL